MNTISTHTTQIEQLLLDLSYIFQTSTNIEIKKDALEISKRNSPKFERLKEKIESQIRHLGLDLELMYESLKKEKESLQEKTLQRESIQNETVQKKESEPKKETVQMKKESIQKKAWELFVKERIRHLRDGYEQVVNEKIPLKEIVKAYYRWLNTDSAKGTGAKKMDAKEIENRCEETFGDSRGKREYANFRVFLDEDDVEEFDKENQKNN